MSSPPCFHDKGLLIRVTSNGIALSPPPILERSHSDRIFHILADVIREIAPSLHT